MWKFSKIERVIAFAMCFLTAARAQAQGRQFRPEDLVLESIQCAGNERVSCETIKHNIHLQLGDRIDEKEVENSRVRLSVTGEFEEVDLSLKKGSSPGKTILLASVKEASPYFSKLNAGLLQFGNNTHLINELTFGTRDFLGSKKTLQGSVRVKQTVLGAEQSFLSGRLTYLDPNLAGSNKYYLVATLGYLSSFGYANLEVGKRVLDFSSIYVGAVAIQPIGIRASNQGVAYVGYGWNTEDDPNFPRSGSNLRAAIGTYIGPWLDFYLDLGYRKHFSIGERSVVTLNLLSYGYLSLADRLYISPLESEHPVLSVRYAYDFGRNYKNSTSFVRGYIEPGLTSFFTVHDIGMNVAYGTVERTPSLKVGASFPSKIFGTVNLFLAGGLKGGNR